MKKQLLNKKDIYLIGLNLYSIFLALQIKSRSKKNNVTIIEASPNFLNAYKKVQIKKYELNPGFHTLEDIRSKGIIKFFNKNLNFKKINKTRGLLIGNNLISGFDNYNQWPKEILNKYKIKKKNFTLNPIKNVNYLNKKYIQYLTNNCFGNEVNYKNTISTTYPWFFPPNYNLLGNDEGTIFNTKIRKKKLKHAYVFPKKGHFSEFSKVLKNLLKKNKIKIELNKPVEFYKKKNKIFFKGHKKIEEPESKKIICLPVVPLCLSIKNKINLPKLKPIKYYTALIEIKNCVNNDLDKFCETIVSSEFAPGFLRISQYSQIFNIKNKKIYQIEFIEHSSEKDIKIQIEKIITLLSNILLFKNSKNKQNVRLIGYTFLRNIFRPNMNQINKLILKTVQFFSNKKNIIFPRQISWPINTNKHFIYSKEDYKNKINNFIND